MGGATKPALAVGGQTLLERVLSAVATAAPRVVVGPLELVPLLPKGVSLTMEHPPGGGPVAAVAAGLGLLAATSRDALVALLASDLPLLSPAVMASLRAAASVDGVDGAVLVDDDGHPQWLAGVWRHGTLADRIPASPHGLGMRQVVGSLRYGRVTTPPD